MTEKDHASALAAGLFRRMRDVILVAERIEDYAFGPEDPARRAALPDAEAPELAREMVLRALRIGAEAVNWAILTSAAEGDRGIPIEELAKRVRLPRLAVTERANELIQAGLCVRAIDADSIVVTEAGLAFVELVAAVSSDLAQRARDASGKERTNGGRGLPVL